MSFSKAQHQAVSELVDLIAAKVGDGRAVHPETAVSSAARVAGSLLLRSFGLPLQDLQPGSVVLSDEANEKGPALVNALGGYLASAGVQLRQEELSGTVARRGEQPRLTIVQSLDLLQDGALKIAARNGLGLDEAARAAAVATGFIVKECAERIGAEAGFNIAAYGFVEGTKTVPPRLAGSAERAGKPWFKFW